MRARRAAERAARAAEAAAAATRTVASMISAATEMSRVLCTPVRVQQAAREKAAPADSDPQPPRVSLGRALYRAEPSGARSTAASAVHAAHGSVSSSTVEPASVPTPTASCVAASGPRPEKRTMAPSGTAPSTGSRKPPTKPGSSTSASSSEPDAISDDARKSTKPYTTMRKSSWQRPNPSCGSDAGDTKKEEMDIAVGGGARRRPAPAGVCSVGPLFWSRV